MDLNQLVKFIISENPHMSALVVDRNGVVIFVNETYLSVLKLPREKVIGKDIRNITPGTRTIQVLKSGKPALGYDWVVNGHQGIACSIPLMENGEIIGAFAYSIFMDIWDKKLRDHIIHSLLDQEKPAEPFSTRYNFDSLVGSNPDFLNLKCLATNIAGHESITVLITGESGTGKELFAHAIHDSSSRARHPFVRVNCASIPENLLESELFGYEEGAYTGARRGGKPGKLEIAHRGTVFLDEIGELPFAMQGKLLVFLQEREIERLGSCHPIKVDVRVLAATNRNLEKMVKDNSFREDLYYRLNVVRIEVPPLRQRKGDIPLLAEHILNRLCQRFQIGYKNTPPDVIDLLTSYSWPGNIRELENVLERALIIADMEKCAQLQPRHLHFQTIDDSSSEEISTTSLRDLKTMVGDFEKQIISQVLKETKNDKIEAAKYLGINLSSLYRKAKRYEIDDFLN